jgi:tetratricopeptide (TPR) repeat protein
MAEAQLRMKNRDKAFELWDEALQIQQKKYGPRHWIVAETLARRGMEHASQERWYEAALDLEKAVHIQKDRLNEIDQPPEDLLLIASKTLLNLGKAHFQMGRVDEALANMNEALAMRLKVHGKHHEVARVHSIIGDVHRHRREYDEAHASYQHALDAYKRAGLPDRHPEIVWARKRASDRSMLGKRFWANAGKAAKCTKKSGKI